MRIALIAIPACLAVLAGCATPVDIPQEPTPLEKRQMQTRYYDGQDRMLTVRSVVATLQDLGFTIDQADAELGAITGTRYDTYTMRMTVTVVARGDAAVSVRANARINESSVDDAATYQDFFAALDKAIYLTGEGVD